MDPRSDNDLRSFAAQRRSSSYLQLFVSPLAVPPHSSATTTRTTTISRRRHASTTIPQPRTRPSHSRAHRGDIRHLEQNQSPATPFFNKVRAALGERALGVDYGLRRIGLAVSVGVNPRTLPVLSGFTSTGDAARKVTATAIASICDTIVVGLPVGLNDGIAYGAQVVETRAFITALRAAAPWAKIYSQDERLTTHQARDRVRIKDKVGTIAVDSIAAAIILERYFDDQDCIPELVQQGSANGCVLPVDTTKNEERVGFAEWKRNAMLRAQQSARDLPRMKTNRSKLQDQKGSPKSK